MPGQTVFDRIIAAKKAAGLSWAQFCNERTGLQRSHLYRFRDPKARPLVETLTRVYRATGADIHWLATGEGEMMRGAPRDPYESRLRAVEEARRLGFSEDAIATVHHIDPGEDRPLAWWVQRIASAQTRVEGPGRSQSDDDMLERPISTVPER